MIHDRPASDIVTDAYLAATHDALDVGGELDAMVRSRIEVRDLRADLAQLERDLDARLVEAMGRDRKAVIDGIGQVEVRFSKRRTAWRHDELLPAVVSRIADDPSTLYDPETGVVLPPALIGSNVAARLRECVSFGAGKVVGLRAIGLQPDEFCSEDEAHASVVLPPREA